MRLFGWIAVDDTHAIATRFRHFGGLPIWPRDTELVDTSTIVVERGRERHLLSTTSHEQTRYEAKSIPRDRRSVLAAYLRTWGVVLACIGLGGVTHSESLLYLGGVLLAGGRGLARFAFLRVGDVCTIVGLGLIIGVVVGFFLAPYLTGALAVAGALAAGATWSWRSTPPAPPRAKPTARAKLPRAVATQAPSPPVTPPLPSRAPERVEPSTDTPRFLT